MNSDNKPRPKYVVRLAVHDNAAMEEKTIPISLPPGKHQVRIGFSVCKEHIQKEADEPDSVGMFRYEEVERCTDKDSADLLCITMNKLTDRTK